MGETIYSLDDLIGNIRIKRETRRALSLALVLYGLIVLAAGLRLLAYLLPG
jgi:hypothetical protein